MKWFKQHWRGIARMLALVFIGAGVFCGYWWYYKLAPFRRTLDPEWYSSHSQREYWSQFQESIHRMGWFHDAGFTVGACGDESWMKWIIDHIEPGTRLDGCMGDGLAHADGALRSISNHDVGEDANAWLAWWEKNKFKSQAEWIAEGFRQRGFEVDVPPTEEQIPVLIAVLGNSDTNELTAIPSEMKHNAFRCLRDSGFDPLVYALSNRTVSTEVERGLMEYARRERLWPAASGVGILPFGKKDEDPWAGMALPALLETRFQITANTLSIGLPLLGVALLILSVRRKKENVETEN
ncbi:MAG: hypothetical protein PHC78_00395 [Verrucomicrobiota bacterium]|nr:hypothetical protein [Verrucomicrobiota bacterium]